MGSEDYDVEKKPISTEHIPGSPEDKPEVLHKESAHEAAERGHTATDM
jgi:hypothetical protein